MNQIDIELIASHEQEIKNREARAVEKIAADPKYFYNYARTLSKVKTPIGPLTDGENIVSDPKGMSEILRKQFESVFNNENSEQPIDVESLLQDYGPRCLEDLEFTEDDIEESIMKIPLNSAPGPDGVPALLLRRCAAVLKRPIFMLWRKSLTAGRLPHCMKISVVTPVFKGGNRGLAENYRPISLTSHLCKLFERIVVTALVSYLNKADLFNKNQHGFRSGRSCLSQLLEHHQEILNALENGAGIDVVYLDFSKAFDRVDYKILLYKLKAIGITGNLLRWLAHFLTGRQQKVKVCQQLSSEGPVLSGVPQGSSLGPLLFLILIADIDSCVNHVRVSSFADDTRFLKQILNDGDCFKMQEDLMGVYKWAEDNKMKFNSSKFELVSYSARMRDLHEINETLGVFNYPQYFDADGKLINSVSTVKDLGVLLTCDASFQKQIDECISRGSRQAGWILRAFRTRDIEPMTILYRSLVLPHLEYCCQLWSPSTIGLIQRIEGIQRSFTAKIIGISHMNYWERLKHLGLYSLERRRERYLIIYVYKIIQGLAPNFQNERYKLKCTYSERRGRSVCIPNINTRASASSVTMVERSFPVKGPRLYNVLPAKIRNLECSADTFKRHLDEFLKNIPDKPCIPAYQQTASNNSIIEQLNVLRAAGVFHP